uniref:Immunoglobulin domain-containing protein n=1 Tax=Cyprinus carpio TaxID=7962 RepID=A0A8C1QRH5_CYPCA
LLLGQCCASAVNIDVSVMEGDSVTLYTDVTKTQDKKVQWYYNNTRIARITGDPNKTCTDVQCTERLRDRLKLKLDHQTGSLTITNTRTTDSGDYRLRIISIRRSSEKTFNVTSILSVFLSVKDVSDSGLSSAAAVVVAVVVVVVLLLLVTAVVYYKRQAIMKCGTRWKYVNCCMKIYIYFVLSKQSQQCLTKFIIDQTGIGGSAVIR